MSRSIGAKDHDIRRCKGCDEAFCATCSRAEHSGTYCSVECEADADVEEDPLIADAADRGRALNLEMRRYA